jgi:ribosome-associated protein
MYRPYATDDVISSINRELEELKAKNIVLIDLENKNMIFKAAIIATGTSSRHVESIADKITQLLKQKYNISTKSEGFHACEWILIDTGYIMVHIFQEETRNRYKLEEIWSSKIKKGKKSLL